METHNDAPGQPIQGEDSKVGTVPGPDKVNGVQTDPNDLNMFGVNENTQTNQR
jgi:hypothetical protein